MRFSPLPAMRVNRSVAYASAPDPASKADDSFEPVCGCPFQCKKFFRLLRTCDQCSRVSGLYMQLSHAAGLYGVRGSGPNR